MAMRKVGDRLKARGGMAGDVHKGDVVRVTSVDTDEYLFSHQVFNETQGRNVACGFALDDASWELLPDEPARSGSDGFYAVCDPDSGTVGTPYSAESSAREQAEQLARERPGHEFYVVRAVGVAVCGPAVYRKMTDKETQR